MPRDRESHEFARHLRSEMNAAETALWQRLRGRRHHQWKFRRQHPLGPYVADFWCPAARVVVELDGASHQERTEIDAVRDKWMNEQKILVIRFRNRELEEDIEVVLKKINEICLARTESPSP